MKRAAAATLPLHCRATSGEHDSVVTDLAVELTAALGQASGDEKKLLDTIFLFVQRVHAVDGATEWLPEIVGVSIARSSLLPGEREAVFRMFPRCDAFGASATGWRQLAARRTLDVGQHCI